MKVIKIDGIKGLLNAVFIGCCLFAGFVISPGYLAMYLWNRYLTTSYMFPQLTLFQGVLLWVIVFLSYCILTKGRFAVSFQSTPEMRDEELESIIKTAKISSQLRMMNKMMAKSDRFEQAEKNPYKNRDSVIEQNSSNDVNEEENISNIK